MPYVMLSIVLLMIGKDTFQLGDPYFMRGGAQILALLVAIGVLLYKPPRHFFPRFWPLLGYVGSMVLTSVQSSIPTFVVLQIGSLMAILLFAIAYFDTGSRPRRESAMIRSVIGVYFCIALASLIIAKFAPGVAYETLYAGDAYGNESRFRGLFSKSAMLAAAGGILVGCAWFGIKSRVLRVTLILPGLVCVGLTLSRTFWLATVLAMGMTAWFYHPSRKRLVIQFSALALLGVSVAGPYGFIFNQNSLSTTLRLHTISKLTGRVDLWERGLEALQHKPWFGYGFTFGSEGLQTAKTGFGATGHRDARNIARVSLHNGYMQSFLDSGIVGTFFYLAIIITALSRFIARDHERRYPATFYCVFFLVIANFGESIIYSASVFHSVLFWIAAVFALGLSETRANRIQPGSALLVKGIAKTINETSRANPMGPLASDKCNRPSGLKSHSVKRGNGFVRKLER